MARNKLHWRLNVYNLSHRCFSSLCPAKPTDVNGAWSSVWEALIVVSNERANPLTVLVGTTNARCPLVQRRDWECPAGRDFRISFTMTSECCEQRVVDHVTASIVMCRLALYSNTCSAPIDILPTFRIVDVDIRVYSLRYLGASHFLQVDEGLYSYEWGPFTAETFNTTRLASLLLLAIELNISFPHSINAFIITDSLGRDIVTYFRKCKEVTWPWPWPHPCLPHLLTYVPNLKFLASHFWKTGMATQNLQNRVVWSSYGSIKVIDKSHSTIFLMYLSWATHFWDIMRYRSKIVIFFLPMCIWSSRWSESVVILLRPLALRLEFVSCHEPMVAWWKV